MLQQYKSEFFGWFGSSKGVGRKISGGPTKKRLKHNKKHRKIAL